MGLQFFITTFSLIISWQVQAAEVTAVNGKDVQINLSQDDFLEPNEKYFLINEQNKRVGFVNIVSVSETEGKTVLLKGSAKPGYKLQLYVPPKTNSKAENKSPESTPTSASKDYLGVYADLMMNQLSLTYGDTAIDLKGQGFGFTVGYQSTFSPVLNIRYTLGYRNFAVKSEDLFCPQGACEITVSYAALGARLNYFLNDMLFA
jgi:hypothetical protein